MLQYIYHLNTCVGQNNLMVSTSLLYRIDQYIFRKSNTLKILSTVFENLSTSGLLTLLTQIHRTFYALGPANSLV